MDEDGSKAKGETEGNDTFPQAVVIAKYMQMDRKAFTYSDNLPISLVLRWRFISYKIIPKI